MTDKQILFSLLGSKPVTRMSLAVRMGVTEHAVERLIGQLRDDGYPICSNSETKGYWVSTGDDLTRTIKEMERRALSTLQRARRMKERQLDGQLEVKL